MLYGGAEFSRDCDIVLLCEPNNLLRLQEVLAELQAVTIAVPSIEVECLLRGHAVHFRCQVQEAEGVRLDVMAAMQGVDSFEELWSRRTTITDERTGTHIEVLSLGDLAVAKRTQRDKDWPMIRRLIEAHYEIHGFDPSEDQVKF